MQYQKQVVDGQEVIYSADWILGLESKAHFLYYWNQLSLVYKACSRSEELLELGVGTNLLSDVLKRRGFKVSTLDIDPDKQPDYCANALDFNYSLKPFTTLLAFEIFEHIPFETFVKVVTSIGNSSIDKIICSVPWCERTFQPIALKLPRVPVWSPSIRIPRGKISTPAHFWELKNVQSIQKLKNEKLLVSFNTLEEVFNSSGWALQKLHKNNNIQFLMASRRATS